MSSEHLTSNQVWDSPSQYLLLFISPYRKALSCIQNYIWSCKTGFFSFKDTRYLFSMRGLKIRHAPPLTSVSSVNLLCESQVSVHCFITLTCDLNLWVTFTLLLRAKKESDETVPWFLLPRSSLNMKMREIINREKRYGQTVANGVSRGNGRFQASVRLTESRATGTCWTQMNIKQKMWHGVPHLFSSAPDFTRKCNSFHQNRGICSLNGQKCCSTLEMYAECLILNVNRIHKPLSG